MKKLNYHPAADAFPMMDDQRYQELVADIRERGQQEPITLCEGMILDGRNRYKACVEIGIEPKTKEYHGDPWQQAWSLNGQRRDLQSEDQRYLIWKYVNEQSEAFQAKQQAIKDEANRKRSEAAKSQHKVSNPRAGEVMVVEQPAPLPENPTHKSREAKIEASKCNIGAVQRGDQLARNRPDLAEKVRRGELKSLTARRIMLEGQDGAASSPKKQEKPPYVDGKPTFEVAMKYAKMAVMDLRMIHRSHHDRDAAFDYVIQWITENR